MTVVVLTLPHPVPDEARHICDMLATGEADLVHIRKPGYTAAEAEEMVQRVLDEAAGRGMDIAPRLAMHDHFEVARRLHLGGIHLNGRNPLPPSGWQGRVSRSCHTLYEAVEWKPMCDYVSLSPVFDSISKPGYRAAFDAATLEEARRRGIIDGRVLALGGVTRGRLRLVAEMGFGGAMLLGDAWKERTGDKRDI